MIAISEIASAIVVAIAKLVIAVKIWQVSRVT